MRTFHHTSRRKFITTATAGMIGSAFASPASKPKVKCLIRLFMNGGMSHLDTFDPKSGNESAPAISTNVPGIFISANLPRLSAHMDKITLIRSMSHTSRNHKSAEKLYPDMSRDAMTAEGNDFLSQINSAYSLAGKGVPLISANLSGWDTHTESSRRNAIQCRFLDEGLSSLLEKLSSGGLINETLVVLTTEFGRCAKINGYGGRNHHPQAYTCLFAGGGTLGGRVIGTTSSDGMQVRGAKTHPNQFAALLSAERYS